MKIFALKKENKCLRNENNNQQAITVGNKAKERISKRVFQENKSRQIFPKTNI